MSEKPIVFISHSSKDEEIAQLMKREIETCFEHSIEAFAANIRTSENWFKKVMAKLNEARAIVVLITPNSVKSSHWVWFELGYFWALHDTELDNVREKEKIYYPLYIDGIELPNPVKDLQVQAGCLNRKSDVTEVFQQLIELFKSGNLDRADIDAIMSVLPAISRPQDEVSEWLIRKKLDDFLMNQLEHYKANRTQSVGNGSQPLNNLFAGKPVVYRELDTKFGFPPDTARNFLIDVAGGYGLEPSEHDDVEIKFRNVRKG